MNHELVEMRKHHKRIDDNFLNHINERYIVFMADGTDYTELGIEKATNNKNK